MSFREWLDELRLEAILVEDMLGRSVSDFRDAQVVALKLIARAIERGDRNDALDCRAANRSTAAALWRRNGGCRFEISEGVAASLVLTKQPTGTFEMPLPAFVAHIPKGYMPSRLLGEFEGGILVVDLGEYVFASSYVDRPGPGGGAILDALIPKSADVETCEVLTQKPDVSQEQDQNEDDIARASKQAWRVIQNLCAWVLAFPPQASTSRSPAPSVGSTVVEQGIHYLRTSVKLDREFRSAAKAVVSSGATHGIKKVAMRHIVRGHWKRQVAGSGLGDRRMIFVQPYWRGPEGAEAWGRVYRALS